MTGQSYGTLGVADINVLDFQSIHAMRTQARSETDASRSEVAGQFEALLLQMLVKSMRTTGFGPSLLDNNHSAIYQQLLDQQLSQLIAGGNSGLGLRQLIEENLSSNAAVNTDVATQPTPTTSHRPDSRVGIAVQRERDTEHIATGTTAQFSTPDSTESLAATDTQYNGESAEDVPRKFVETVWPLARQAAVQIGVDPRVLVAQSALETGWGRAVIKREDGSSGNNMFGIKADSRWQGESVTANALEFVDGTMTRRPEQFRAYESSAGSFADYVDFLRSNPRYGEALRVAGDTGAYLKELQRAGYATDPNYAEKILSIVGGKHLSGADVLHPTQG